MKYLHNVDLFEWPRDWRATVLQVALTIPPGYGEHIPLLINHFPGNNLHPSSSRSSLPEEVNINGKCYMKRTSFSVSSLLLN